MTEEGLLEFIQMLDEIGAKAQAHMPYVPTISNASGEPEVRINGKDYVQFCTSNYLGLANDPRVKQAAKDAIDRYGIGTNGSRLISGTLEIHKQIEAKIAEFKVTEAATLFSSGTFANLGFLQAAIAHPLRALEGESAPKGKIDVFYDGLVHQSLIDGINLARCRAKHFKHNDLDGLMRRLAKSDGRYKMIVVDGVYSADGDVAPLGDLIDLCEMYDALLFVDDAHGTGVLGDHGRGTCELFGVESSMRIVQMGTLSKAFGASGGYIAGSQAMTDYLRVGATSYVFTASLPAAITAAALKAIEIAQQESWRREKALSNAAYVRENVAKMGFDVGRSCTQIVPIIIGDEEKTRAASLQLLKAEIYAQSMEFPAAARGRARIRLSTTALHERDHLDRLLGVLEDLALHGSYKAPTVPWEGKDD